MSVEPHLTFFNSPVLGQPGSLEKILVSLQQKGLRLCDFYVGSYRERDAHWDTYSPETQHGLEVAYAKHNLTFEVQNETERFELFVHLNWNIDLGDSNKHAHIGAVTFSTSYFHSDEITSAHYSRLFLDFGKLLYSIVQPDFGWIDMSDPAGSTWFDDIARLAIPYVYWANFFGKAYTTKYGIEKFLRSPAWLSEPLEDHGVLVVLSPHLGTSDKVDQVKSYFDEITRPFQ